MMEGLNNCINTRCSKYGIEKFVPMEWKGKIIDKIDEKKKLSNKTYLKFYKSVLQQSNLLNTLYGIHNPLAVTPIDKTNGNVDFSNSFENSTGTQYTA